MKDQDGQEVTLASFKGEKYVVLYFYPKDNTVREPAQERRPTGRPDRARRGVARGHAEGILESFEGFRRPG